MRSYIKLHKDCHLASDDHLENVIPIILCTLNCRNQLYQCKKVKTSRWSLQKQDNRPKLLRWIVTWYFELLTKLKWIVNFVVQHWYILNLIYYLSEKLHTELLLLPTLLYSSLWWNTVIRDWNDLSVCPQPGNWEQTDVLYIEHQLLSELMQHYFSSGDAVDKK